MCNSAPRHVAFETWHNYLPCSNSVIHAQTCRKRTFELLNCRVGACLYRMCYPCAASHHQSAGLAQLLTHFSQWCPGQTRPQDLSLKASLSPPTLWVGGLFTAQGVTILAEKGLGFKQLLAEQFDGNSSFYKSNCLPWAQHFSYAVNFIFPVT